MTVNPQISADEIISAALSTRSVFVGVGNRLKGDDGFGSHLIEKLKEITSDVAGVECWDVGAAPENFLGKIDVRDREMLIIFDAVRGKRSGPVRGGNTDENLVVSRFEGLSGAGFSTHTMTLKMLNDYFKSENPQLEIYFIGAVLDTTELDTGISERIRRIIDETVNFIRGCLCTNSH